MPDTHIQDLCEGVSGAHLQRHVAEFAKRMKLSGTPDELESFRYLKSQLDTLGFATDLILHDAYISLPGRASLRVGNHAPDCITHSFSRPSPPGGARGEVVYAKSGSEADFAAIDARGKIALLEGIANPGASLRASRAGAIGQIHISPHEHKHEMCISSVWGSPTHESRENLPRTVVVSVALADGTKIRDAVANGERVEAVLEAEVDTGWRKTPILQADMHSAGGGADENFVLFSGHHDTWYYGVMDNGTANATMLEVARLSAGERERWRRGLRLCFWSGHSHGRYSGSAWYADHHWDELNRRCVAHVNVDSTGGKGATVLEEAQAAAELRALARDAIRTQAGQELEGRRMSRAGDQSFWGVGLPVMFMSLSEQSSETAMPVAGAVMGGGARRGAGLGWWWHTPDDLADKIDPAFHARDTRVYVHTLSRLLEDEILPLRYSDHATDLLAEIAALARKVGGKFDLAPLVSRAETLLDGTKWLESTKENPARINAALMALSRALVPIEYTSGDRFDHDPALPQSPCPPLDPVRRLAAAENSDDAHFLGVAATRAKNRVAHALDQANAIIAATRAGTFDTRIAELV